jgi:uncharacterized protein
MKVLPSILIGALLSLPVEAAAMDLSLALYRGGRVTKAVRSLKELREEGVVLQHLDYSCGAAAMATLLTYFFRDKVTEEVVIGFIFIHGQTPEEGLKRYFRRKGFSLLDLKRFVEFRGYKSAGYKEMTLQDLLELLDVDRVPVLVPIRPMGYNHFVVVRGIRGDRVFLADPATGNTTVTIARFEDLWVDGIGFIVTKQPLAKFPRTIPPDQELAAITAAGAPSRSDPTAPPASPPPLMTLRATEPVPNAQDVRSLLERQPPAVIPRFQQSISDDRGTNLVTLFSVQAYSPIIQFGQPRGNFIDFSPPPGQSLQIHP